MGRPKLVINLTKIDYLRSWQFTGTTICHTLCVSRTTLWWRLKEVNYNFRQEGRFTVTSDIDLHQQVAGIKAEFENCGEKVVIGIIRSTGIHVPRHRVRDIIRRIDPINTALRLPACRRLLFARRQQRSSKLWRRCGYMAGNRSKYWKH